jgi:hypothetical protein
MMPKPGDLVKVEFTGVVKSLLRTGSGSNWDVEVELPVEFYSISTFVRHEHVTPVEEKK